VAATLLCLTTYMLSDNILLAQKLTTYILFGIILLAQKLSHMGILIIKVAFLGMF